MATKIQLRRDTAANWATANPVLSQGEPALETDTNRVKYGDGVSDWALLPYSDGGAYTRSGASGKAIGIREVSGVTSFTFSTTGHRNVFFVANSSLLGNTTVSIDATTSPNIVYAQKAIQEGLICKYFVANNAGSVTGTTQFDQCTVSGNIYTLTLSGGETFNNTMPINIGDEIIISSWTRGTQASFPDYVSTGHPAVGPNPAANTNTILLDLTSDYLYTKGPVLTANLVQNIITYPGKSDIVFYDGYTNLHGAAAEGLITRTITGANNVTANVWALTFSGTPLNVGQQSITVNTHVVFPGTSSSLVLDYSTNRDLLYWDPNVVGQVFVNGTPAANVVPYSFEPQGSISNTGFGAIGLIGFDVIALPLDQSIVTQTSDDITLIYTKTTFARVDYYLPNQIDSSSLYYNNAYNWFNFDTELPQSVNMAGNGVRSGTIHGYITVYDTKDLTTEASPFNNWFDIRNSDTIFNPISGLGQPTTDNDYNNAISTNNSVPIVNYLYNTSGGEASFGDVNYVYWDFYASGIFFSKAPWNLNYQYISRDLQVDIAYKMTLFVCENNADNWC